MRILVVGVGYWGPNIVRNLVDIPSVEAIGISDMDQERAKKIAAKFPRTHVARPAPEAFTDGYDATIIVTPVVTHAALAEAALNQGLHVLIEKPLTRTSQEARRLIALAEEKNLRLMAGHVFHYKPTVRALVDLMKSGEIGKIHYIDSIRVNLGLFRSDVNVLWDLAPHDLSIFEAILNKMPKRVHAVGACHVPHPTTPQETMSYLTLDYGDGCIGHIHVNWYSPLKQRLMVVAGSKKMAVYDDASLGEPLRVYDRGTYDPVADTPLYPTMRTGDTLVPFIKMDEPLQLQLREFVDSIEERRPPQTDGCAGLRIIQILEAADRSLKAGAFVDVDSEEDVHVDL